MNSWNLWYGKLQKRHQYYVRFLVPFFICWFILAFVPCDFLIKIFFGLGFIYPFFLYTPNLEKFFDRKRYRLSVVRTLWRLNEFSADKIEPYDFKFKEEVSKSLFIFLFTLVLSLISLNFYFLVTPVGSIAFFFLKNKIYKE